MSQRFVLMKVSRTGLAWYRLTPEEVDRLQAAARAGHALVSALVFRDFLRKRQPYKLHPKPWDGRVPGIFLYLFREDESGGLHLVEQLW